MLLFWKKIKNRDYLSLPIHAADGIHVTVNLPQLQDEDDNLVVKKNHNSALKAQLDPGQVHFPHIHF